jgi:hypothetical protein
VVELSRRLVQIVPEEVWPQSIDSAIFTARSRNVYQTLVIAVELCENRGLDDDPRDRTARNADAEPTGDFFPEESMPVLYPNLSARFS